MGITTRCTGCGATSLDGVLTHADSCLAKKPATITLENKLPPIAIQFDTPEEQKKFEAKLKKGGAFGLPVLPADSVHPPLSKNPSPSKGLLKATSPINPTSTNIDSQIDDILSQAEDVQHEKRLIKDLIATITEEAEVRGRIAELWNPALGIPENEKAIRERIKQLNDHLANTNNQSRSSDGKSNL